jgi:hypothetical protein
LRIANISSQQQAAAIGVRINPHKIYRGFHAFAQRSQAFS